MARHMFPGSNTPNGFFSYFDQVLSIDEAQKIIYLKGASGCGKSTFMRKIGAEFELLGDEVEYLHCSNDAQSLDGVCIRNKGICVFDGTAPHISDPKIPIAIDEIINLAEYIDESGVIPHKDELLSLGKVKKILIDTAYGYYAAAYAVYKNNILIYDSALGKSRVNAAADEMLEMINDLYAKSINLGKNRGRNRKLFASTVSPMGKTSYLDTIVNTSTVYRFSGYAGIDNVLEIIQRYVNMKGTDTESFYCPMNPKKLEHLIIPALDVSFITSNRYHTSNLKTDRAIDFNEFFNSSVLDKFSGELSYNSEMFDELLQKTMDTLKRSKNIHEDIEKIYCRNLMIKGLDEVYEKTINRLKAIR